MTFRQKVPENPKDAQVAAQLMQAYEELRYKLFFYTSHITNGNRSF